MGKTILLKSSGSTKRKSHCKRRVFFLHGKNKRIFKNIKRRRFISLGKRRLSTIKNRIKKAISESNGCVNKNEEKIVDNTVINAIIEKMKLVQL